MWPICSAWNGNNKAQTIRKGSKGTRRLVRNERITLLGAALTGLGTETRRQSPGQCLGHRHHVSRYRGSKTESPDNASGDRYLGSRYRDLKTETWTKPWLPLLSVSASGLEDGAPGLGFMAPGLRSSAREKGRRTAARGRGPWTRCRDPGTTNRWTPAQGREPGIAVGVAGF